MARTAKVNGTKQQPARGAEPLGPGLHGARIELQTESSFRIRTTSGQHVVAALGDGVDPRLAADCLRTGRMVIACDTDCGPTIVGALQTSLPIAADPDGVLAIAVKDLRLVAERSVAIETGGASVRLEKEGVVRIEGDKMLVDMPAIVRILSAFVELP